MCHLWFGSRLERPVNVKCEESYTGFGWWSELHSKPRSTRVGVVAAGLWRGMLALSFITLILSLVTALAPERYLHFLSKPLGRCRWRLDL